MTVHSRDGSISCTLENDPPATSGPTNTVHASCGSPLSFTHGLSTNAVVDVTAPESRPRGSAALRRAPCAPPALPDGGVGAAAEQGDCRPAVAGDDRSVGAEAVAEWRQLLGARRWLDPPCDAVALPDAEVVDGPDVEPAQFEHQVHLRGPAADAPDGDERCDQLIVAEPRRSVQLDGAVQDLGREVAQRGQLVAGQSGRSQRLIGNCGERLRCQGVADS